MLYLLAQAWPPKSAFLLSRKSVADMVNATFAAIFTPVGRYLLTGVNMAANVAFTMSATDFL